MDFQAPKGLVDTEPALALKVAEILPFRLIVSALDEEREFTGPERAAMRRALAQFQKIIATKGGCPIAASIVDE